MAISLKDAETDRLAREVAALTGETLTEAVRKALAERLERERRRRSAQKGLAERLNEIARHCAALPDLDTHGADEIISYDEFGVPRARLSGAKRTIIPPTSHRRRGAC